MNSGEICHHAKMFMGAGEEKIAEMIQQEPGREQAGAGAGQAGTSRGRSRPDRFAVGSNRLVLVSLPPWKFCKQAKNPKIPEDFLQGWLIPNN